MPLPFTFTFILFKNQFQTMGVIVPIICVSIYVVLIWWLLKDDDTSEPTPSTRSSRSYHDNTLPHFPPRYSNTNNHDHTKRRYSTRSGAEAVVNRMQRNGCDPNSTLNVYYNDELDAYFVGNRWH